MQLEILMWAHGIHEHRTLTNQPIAQQAKLSRRVEYCQSYNVGYIGNIKSWISVHALLTDSVCIYFASCILVNLYISILYNIYELYSWTVKFTPVLFGGWLERGLCVLFVSWCILKSTIMNWNPRIKQFRYCWAVSDEWACRTIFPTK